VKRRLIIGLAVGAAVFTTVFAMAATLGVTSSDLAAGDQTVAACDSNGVTTAYTTEFDTTTNRYEVTEVIVSGIALDADTPSPSGDGCDGQELSVTLRDTTNAIVGQGSVTNIDAASETVSVSPDPTAEGAAEVHVLIAE
jgi:hypothetical protein